MPRPVSALLAHSGPSEGHFDVNDFWFQHFWFYSVGRSGRLLVGQPKANSPYLDCCACRLTSAVHPGCTTPYTSSPTDSRCSAPEWLFWWFSWPVWGQPWTTGWSSCTWLTKSTCRSGGPRLPRIAGCTPTKQWPSSWQSCPISSQVPCYRRGLKKINFFSSQYKWPVAEPDSKQCIV